MAERVSEYDPLASISESEAEHGEEARLARRMRRENTRLEVASMDAATMEAMMRDEEECTTRMERCSTKDNPREGITTPTVSRDITDPGEGPSTGPRINRDNFNFKRARGAADLNGADPSRSEANPVDPRGTGLPGQSQTADPSGAGQTPPDPSGGGAEQGFRILSGAYETVNLRRKNSKTNPNLRGGVALEKSNIGSFSLPGDDKIERCHTRYLVEKNQNISMSFDPVTMSCYICKDRGEHSVGLGGDGGGGQNSVSCSPTKISPLASPVRAVSA